MLLAKDGKPLSAGAFGEANKNFGVPNTLDTKFNLGSMNKMFTAVAIAQLVERGMLSFDDTLAKFLRRRAARPSAAKVRIKHLLSHTSGLGSYFTDEWDGSRRARVPQRRRLDAARRRTRRCSSSRHALGVQQHRACSCSAR